MKVEKLFYGSWFANCYLITAADAEGKLHAAVVDPAYPPKDIVAKANAMDASIDLIILTHGHFDHIYHTDTLKDLTNATVCIHRDDAPMLSDGEKNAYSFFFGGDFTCRDADLLLSDGDKIALGASSLSVISTPGHSRGSICLLGDGFMITGDTLFKEGYGRYDLYGGNARELARSLASLNNFDGVLTVYPGHGESTSLGRALENIYF